MLMCTYFWFPLSGNCFLSKRQVAAKKAAEDRNGNVLQACASSGADTKPAQNKQAAAGRLAVFLGFLAATGVDLSETLGSNHTALYGSESKSLCPAPQVGLNMRKCQPVK